LLLVIRIQLKADFAASALTNSLSYSSGMHSFTLSNTLSRETLSSERSSENFFVYAAGFGRLFTWVEHAITSISEKRLLLPHPRGINIILFFLSLNNKP